MSAQLERAITGFKDRWAFGPTNSKTPIGRMKACMSIALEAEPGIASAALAEAQRILASAIPDDARPFKVRLKDLACRKLLEEFSLGMSALRRKDFKSSKETNDHDDDNAR